MVALDPRGPKRRRPLAAALLGAVLAAAAALPAAADFLDSYKAGLEATDAGDWPTVERLMREAIAGKPEADARLGRRFYFRRYIPHYYLGLALYEQGDCPGAVAAWAESERQGVIQRFDEEYRLLQEGRALCRQRQEQMTESVRTAQAEIDRAGEAADAADALGQGLGELWRAGEPSPVDRLRQAQRSLQEAREQLAAGRASGDPAAVAAAGRTAADARARLEALEREAAQLQRQRQDRRQELLGVIEPRLEAARRLLRATAYLQPYPPEVGRRRQELQGMVAAGETLGTETDVDRLERYAQRLAAAANALEQAAAPPPRRLLDAAEAFFQGEHERVLELLAEADLGNRRATAQAHLFRAAARYALYVGGGQRDGELLAAARDDVRSCRETDSACSPLPQAFSPRFQQFFATQLPPPEDPAQPPPGPASP